ncbi:MAG TPA: LPXTG cell wall anchor domain-containing protein, partial [Microthrixaceae bacterium]|nr:LPXTG cell wall anchor domain-containing protein [Microthrixaceae bacterium]
PAPLPAAAVAGATETQGTSSAADAQAAGLAFTGSTIRLPVLIGVGLLVAGVLLLLKRRRQG